MRVRVDIHFPCGAAEAVIKFTHQAPNLGTGISTRAFKNGSLYVFFCVCKYDKYVHSVYVFVKLNNVYIYICINKYILIYLFISIDKHTQTIYKTKVICTCVSKNKWPCHPYTNNYRERENQREFYDVLCTSIYQEVKHE